MQTQTGGGGSIKHLDIVALVDSKLVELQGKRGTGIVADGEEALLILGIVGQSKGG